MNPQNLNLSILVWDSARDADTLNVLTANNFTPFSTLTSYWNPSGLFRRSPLRTSTGNWFRPALPVPDKTFAAVKDTPMVGRATRVGNEGAGRVGICSTSLCVFFLNEA